MTDFGFGWCSGGSGFGWDEDRGWGVIARGKCLHHRSRRLRCRQSLEEEKKVGHSSQLESGMACLWGICILLNSMGLDQRQRPLELQLLTTHRWALSVVAGSAVVGESSRGYSAERRGGLRLQEPSASVYAIGVSSDVRRTESLKGLDPAMIDADSMVESHQRQGECCHALNRTQEVGRVSQRWVLIPTS